MAREYDQYTRRGATIAAIVIDTPEQNAAMVEKLALPFPILSDPDGTRAIKRLKVWDAEGKMATPAIIVLAPDGHEAYRYAGVDFMDRPNDDAILDTLASLGLPATETPPGTIAHLDPRPGNRAIRLDNLAVYMRGVRFASKALADRARDPVDKAEAERTSRMAERYVAAQGATLRLVKQHVT
ncbi:MAG: peroxiredoxin family protein [Actinomycetota bacterium]|nr:peroxiredoxin family protein [Actinomycetota bacterium]